jgi:hypothetical protein
MRRDEWIAGQPLCVREPFEERNTGASSSRRGRGLSRYPRRGREPADDITAGPLLAISTVASSPAADRPVTDVLGWHCWAMRRVASSRGTGSTVEKARY